MKSILQANFRAHPKQVGETYLQHMQTAFGFAHQFIKCTFFCSVHAIFPWLYTTRASSEMTDLHQKLVLQRTQQRKPHDS